MHKGDRKEIQIQYYIPYMYVNNEIKEVLRFKIKTTCKCSIGTEDKQIARYTAMANQTQIPYNQTLEQRGWEEARTHRGGARLRRGRG